MNDNVQISINAMQQRLTALETEIVIKMSQNEQLEAENKRLTQELERLKAAQPTELKPSTDK